MGSLKNANVHSKLVSPCLEAEEDSLLNAQQELFKGMPDRPFVRLSHVTGCQFLTKFC